MKTLQLATPIQVGPETVTELVFQDLKAKHIRKLSKEPSVSDLLDLASKLTCVIPSGIDELSAEDTFKVLEIVDGFFPRSQKTMAAE